MSYIAHLKQNIDNDLIFYEKSTYLADFSLLHSNQNGNAS